LELLLVGRDGVWLGLIPRRRRCSEEDQGSKQEQEQEGSLHNSPRFAQAVIVKGSVSCASGPLQRMDLAALTVVRRMHAADDENQARFIRYDGPPNYLAVVLRLAKRIALLQTVPTALKV
jgi:hypothetical protein